ncbi:hypothetical protein GCM10009632_19930 [Mycolicibacterium alvei]
MTCTYTARRGHGTYVLRLRPSPRCGVRSLTWVLPQQVAHDSVGKQATTVGQHQGIVLPYK